MTATTEFPRKAHHPVDRMFVERWSPRAFSGEEIPQKDLAILFEAARWAPSSYNSQPWRFFYARPGDANFAGFVGLLSANNQTWAKHAGALLVLASKKSFTPAGAGAPVESRSHSFDAGAAWANFALQAHLLGYGVHAMGGFDVERAKTLLGMPEDFRPEIAIAVGRRGDKARLPEALQARETPNGRKAQEEFVFAGPYAERP
ncbi:nitroreductase family protein [Methylocella sp.]|uniref:nitroreductase family protein n=1 Tax=Methylocella sp. TaxID=1978226 RepID=UPI003784B5ED